MGEILGYIGLVVFVCFAVFLVFMVGKHYIEQAEPSLLSDKQIAKRTQVIARQSVRMLQHLHEQDELLPFLSIENKKEIERIIHAYDQL